MNTTQSKPRRGLQRGGSSLCFLDSFIRSVSQTLLWAAEPAKAAPQASETKPAPPQPVAINASEIIPRAEQTLRSLQETRFDLAADSESALNSLEKEIAAFAEKSDRRWQGEVESIGELHSLQRLNDVLREWSVEQSQLDGWDQALARRSQILVAQEDDVRQIYETWQATRDAGKQQAFPKVALQKIAEVLREADAVRGLIRDGMAKLLNLQIQLANRREVLAKIRSDIDKAREESGRQLFVLDSLPLWQAIFSPESQEVMIAQATQSSQSFAADLSEFGNKYRDRILWHASLSGRMVLLFRSLRRGLTAPAVEQLGGFALFVLERFVTTLFPARLDHRAAILSQCGDVDFAHRHTAKSDSGQQDLTWIAAENVSPWGLLVGGDLCCQFFALPLARRLAIGPAAFVADRCRRMHRILACFCARTARSCRHWAPENGLSCWQFGSYACYLPFPSSAMLSATCPSPRFSLICRCAARISLH